RRKDRARPDAAPREPYRIGAWRRRRPRAVRGAARRLRLDGARRPSHAARVRQPYVLFAIAVGLIGLGLDFIAIAGTMGPPQSRSLPDMLVYYWTFLTNLSNLALICIYLATLTNWRGLR